MNPSAQQALAQFAAQYGNVRPAVIGVVGTATDSKLGFLRGLTLKPLKEVRHAAFGEKWSLQPHFDHVHRILYLCLAWLGDGNALVDAYASPPADADPELHGWLAGQEAGYTRCMLALFHMCHIVLFVQRGRHLSLHSLRQLRALQALKASLSASLAAHGPASPRAASAPSTGPALASSVAPGACQPLMAFVFEMTEPLAPGLDPTPAAAPASAGAPAGRGALARPQRGPAGRGLTSGPPGAAGDGAERAAVERTRRALHAQLLLLLRRLRLGSTLPEGPGIAPGAGISASSQYSLFTIDPPNVAFVVRGPPRALPPARPGRPQPAQGVQGGQPLVAWLLADIMSSARPTAGPAGDLLAAGGYDPSDEEEEGGEGPAASPPPGPRASPAEDEAAGYSALRAFVLTQVHRLTQASRAAAGPAPGGPPATPASRRLPEMLPTRDWVPAALALFNLFFEKEGEAPAAGPARQGPARPARILDGRLGPGSDPEHAFSAARAALALPRAKEAYLKDLPPLYGKDEHEARLQAAAAVLAAQCRGPAAGQALGRLKEECARAWAAGRRCCEARSLSGRPCLLPAHRLPAPRPARPAPAPSHPAAWRSEEDEPSDGSRPHSSGHGVRRACACGRTVASFDDFFPDEGGREPPEDAERWELPGCCAETSRARLAPPTSGPASRAYRLGLFRMYDSSRGLPMGGFMRGASLLYPWFVDPATDAAEGTAPEADAAWPTPGAAAARSAGRAPSPPPHPAAPRASYAAALGVRDAAAAPASPTAPFVGAHYGLEYECDAGHRFIAALDRSDAALDLPRLAPCPGCAGKGEAEPGPPLGTVPPTYAPPGPAAQLVRMFVAVPAEAPATLRVSIRAPPLGGPASAVRAMELIAASLAPSPIPEASLDVSCGPYGLTIVSPSEVVVPRNSLIAVRFPFIYEPPA